MSLTKQQVIDLTCVIELAVLTEDLGPGEQAALRRVAGTVDRAINKQSRWNPHLIGADGPGPCTYSQLHGKDCVCRGSGEAVEPVQGWSRLEGMVG